MRFGLVHNLILQLLLVLLTQNALPEQRSLLPFILLALRWCTFATITGRNPSSLTRQCWKAGRRFLTQTARTWSKTSAETVSWTSPGAKMTIWRSWIKHRRLRSTLSLEIGCGSTMPRWGGDHTWMRGVWFKWKGCGWVGRGVVDVGGGWLRWEGGWVGREGSWGGRGVVELGGGGWGSRVWLRWEGCGSSGRGWVEVAGEWCERGSGWDERGVVEVMMGVWWSYSHFRIFSSNCTLHNAITHVITVLER